MQSLYRDTREHGAGPGTFPSVGEGASARRGFVNRRFSLVLSKVSNNSLIFGNNGKGQIRTE